MIRATFAASTSVALALALFAAPGCIIPSITQTSDDAGSSSSSSSADGGGSTATAAPVVKGGSCTAVTASVSLCATISSCPSLTLSAQVFPECGFRISGSAIDPECWCNNEYLCPIGKPTSCTEAAQDSSGDVTYDSVCEQVVTGGCTDLGTASTNGSSSAACQACAAQCDNVPSCIEACGC